MTSQKTPNDILNESAKRILNGWNTRATPSADTLAGLDRYNKVYDYEVGSDRMMWSANGEYVLYSEAAAMLVEKDAEIESLREKYREAVRNAFKDSNSPISGKMKREVVSIRGILYEKITPSWIRGCRPTIEYKRI